MKLDQHGVLIPCASCGTMNRLNYAALERPTKCGKCRTALPFPAAPIDVPGTALFDAAISSASVPVVVDFWAAWCGPCRMVAPELQKVAQNMAGKALILKVDTDAHPELSARFSIRSIPTLAIFKGGREVNRVSGVRPAAAIESLIAA